MTRRVTFHAMQEHIGTSRRTHTRTLSQSDSAKPLSLPPGWPPLPEIPWLAALWLPRLSTGRHGSGGSQQSTYGVALVATVSMLSRVAVGGLLAGGVAGGEADGSGCSRGGCDVGSAGVLFITLLQQAPAGS